MSQQSNRFTEQLKKAAIFPFIVLIRFYQICISPLKPASCRFTPTCSQYAKDAIEIHGVFKGLILAICRLMRCNILFPGGVDPVPPKKEKKCEHKGRH